MPGSADGTMNSCITIFPSPAPAAGAISPAAMHSPHSIFKKTRMVVSFVIGLQIAGIAACYVPACRKIAMEACLQQADSRTVAGGTGIGQRYCSFQVY